MGRRRSARSHWKNSEPLDHSPDSPKLRPMHTPQTWSEPSSARSLVCRQIKEARNARENKDAARQGSHCSAMSLAPMSAAGPSGERQEHLDAIITFAGTGRHRRFFRILDIMKVKWATGYIPEECRFLLKKKTQHQKCSMTSGFDLASSHRRRARKAHHARPK